MAILIRGGTVIDADRSYRADVLCAEPQDGGTILQIAEKIDAPADATIVDAHDQYVTISTRARPRGSRAARRASSIS